MIALVTGTTGGFGSVLASTLAEAGLTVYGTGRNPAEADGPVRMIPMDVSSDDSVAEAIRRIIDREGRLDVVVNCVNEMVVGTIEEQTAAEVARVYDTNVFGALRVWQQALPVMRKQGENGEGLLVSMSSLGGLLAVPTMSAYTSSKFALEAMSEALHRELRGTGIDVVIMQPVAMKMDRPATGSHLQTVAGVGEGSRRLKMLDKMHADTEASGLTPEAVAQRVLELIRGGKRSLRVPMDRAKPLSVVKRLAPQDLIDRMIDGLLS